MDTLIRSLKFTLMKNFSRPRIDSIRNFGIVGTVLKKTNIKLMGFFLVFVTSLTALSVCSFAQSGCDAIGSLSCNAFHTTVINLDDPNFPVCGTVDIPLDLDGDIGGNGANRDDCTLNTGTCGPHDPTIANCHRFIFERDAGSLTQQFTMSIGQGNGCNGELDASFSIIGGICEQLTCEGSQSIATFTFPIGETGMELILCLNSQANVSICGLCKEPPPCTEMPECNLTDVNTSSCGVENCSSAIPAVETDYNNVFTNIGTCSATLRMQAPVETGDNVCDADGVNFTRKYTLEFQDADGLWQAFAECDQEIVVTILDLPDCDITGPTEVCPSSETCFSGPVAPVGTSYSYAWSIIGGDASIAFDPDCDAVNEVNVVAGTENFIVQLIVTDDNTLCSNTCTANVAIGMCCDLTVDCPDNDPVPTFECGATLPTPEDLFGQAGGSYSNACGTVTITTDYTHPGPCGGTVNFTYTITDDNGTPGDPTDDVVETCPGVLVINPIAPTFSCPLDIPAISCTAADAFTLADAPAATYSNGEGGNCEISGDATAVSMVRDYTACGGGTITVTYEYDYCGETLSDECVVPVEAASAPTFSCPLDIPAISCTAADAFTLADAPAATYSNGEGGNCEISGDATAVSMVRDYTACGGGTITVTYEYDYCGETLSDECVVPVEAASAPTFSCPLDIPAISCTAADAFTLADAPAATYSNGEGGNCEISGDATAVSMVRDYTACGGGTINS